MDFYEYILMPSSGTMAMKFQVPLFILLVMNIV